MLKPLLTTLKAYASRLGRGADRTHFDETFYKRAYPDVVASGVDPFSHYMTNGWREGRNPSAKFNTLYYRDAHLSGAFTNPLTHYVEAGGVKSEYVTWPDRTAMFDVQRAVILKQFDPQYYRLNAGDMGRLDPISHYLEVGCKEGRSPAPGFDPSKYVRDHAFVAQLDVSPFYHFVSQNRLLDPTRASLRATTKQKSEPIPPKILKLVRQNFDTTYYLKTYQDVRDAKHDPIEHFLQHGWTEGRSPTPLFDCHYYTINNPEIASAGINPFVHYLTVGCKEGRRPNGIGTRLYPRLQSPSHKAWSTLKGAASTSTSEYIVIMPVYKGYDETLASIYAVLANEQRTAFALHVINDVTPDHALDAEITRLSEEGLFSYERNSTNLGFVKSVNKGLRRFSDKQIVLLNADTQVFGNWLDRIDAHAKRDERIATITPFSNNATICSYPISNQNNLVEPEVDASELDALAAECNRARVSEIPTGVGFCLYMSKHGRDKIGLLDEDAFGKGYGEENDYCMRAAKAGLRNVLAEDIFVYHAGQVSFAAFATEEYGPGQKALVRKHPDYPTQIKQYFEADPGLHGRIRLDLLRLARATGPNCIIYIYHALTGGVVTHVKHMEQRLRAEGIAVIHLRVGVGDRWSVTIESGADIAPFCPNIQPMGFKQFRPLLAEFIEWIRPKAIHMHSVAGFDWEATTGLFEFIRSGRVPYYFTLHDYSVVCHRNDLVLTNSTYCGLPDVDVCRSCVATDRTYPEAIDPSVRRSAYANFLQGAAAVFAPSEDVKNRLESSGTTSYSITVHPHEENYNAIMALGPSKPRQTIDVVIIGAIGPHKGSRLILSLARDATARNLPLRYHIIGYSDLSEEMAGAGVSESGRYANEAEAVELIKEIGPTCAFLPSIWPETFCYTLSLAFQLQVPPVVFDIGAQRDRVLAENYGFVIPYDLIDNIKAINDTLCNLRYTEQQFDNRIARIGYDSIQADYYGLR